PPLLLAIAYAFLFHHAEFGINLFLFDALLIGLALWARPELGKYAGFVWSVGGLLFAAGSVVIVHSELSILAHHLTFILVLGFAQARELRFCWYAILLGISTFFEAPKRAWRKWWVRQQQQKEAQVMPALRWLKQGIIPALVLLPFLGLYLGASEQLAAGMDRLLARLEAWSFNPTLFWSLFLMGLGFLLTLGYFFPRTNLSRLVQHQLGFKDVLTRRRPERMPSPPPASYPTRHPRTAAQKALYAPPLRKSLALKAEYRQAVLTFGLLNLLLAIVNATDLRYVWLATSELSAATLSQYVHTGTWNLLLSIALAMVVVLYYFRGNLNFLQQASYLKPLAKLWVIQNVILGLSVWVRNLHYMNAYGLALGRIYVIFVLLLILFGLYTLFRKVRDRLSLTYLLQTNGLAAWLALLLLAAVNWPCVITRHNVARNPDKIDWYYLTEELPAANTFLLLSHPEAKVLRTWKSEPKYHQYADWRSWNYADWRNVRALDTGDAVGR
ncbi:MAG: DUF4153 domain-containing protein, partial [Bacteroidota bacterium]